MTIEKRDYRACQHDKGVLVSHTVPKVTCRICEEVLCPYWVIRQMANKFLKLDYRLADMAELEEKEAVRREKDRLRREKRDARVQREIAERNKVLYGE